MLTTSRLPTRQTRKAIREARVVYVRTRLGLFKISKREALSVIRPNLHAAELTVSRWQDTLCINADPEE